MEGSIIQIITIAGAAGAFFLVLNWIVNGRLHSDSEVVGLREDKAELLRVNGEQAAALNKSNDLLEKALNTIDRIQMSEDRAARDSARADKDDIRAARDEARSVRDEERSSRRSR